MAQAMKLANNFLSATALAATSEAIAFGTSVGLDMATMLEVLNASSGQSAATSDKFVNHVAHRHVLVGLPQHPDGQGRPALPRGGGGRTTPAAVVAAVTVDMWSRFAADEPGADFTRIYPFTAGDDLG